MIIIRGNSSKSSINLDVVFDEMVLVNTLTLESSSFKDVHTVSRGLYSKCLLDFTGLEVGEYKYLAMSSGSCVQTGLLQIEPFDEEEKAVQIVTPSISRSVVTYQN